MRRWRRSVPAGGGLLGAWDVRRLVRRSRGLPVFEPPLTALPETDGPARTDDVTPTPRQVADHMGQARDVEPRHPILPTAVPRITDGRHRVVRALRGGRDALPAMRFDPRPEPRAGRATLADPGCRPFDMAAAGSRGPRALGGGRPRGPASLGAWTGDAQIGHP